jgi:hypothetical protein
MLAVATVVVVLVLVLALLPEPVRTKGWDSAKENAAAEAKRPLQLHLRRQPHRAKPKL